MSVYPVLEFAEVLYSALLSNSASRYSHRRGENFLAIFLSQMDHVVELPSHLLFPHPETIITHGFDELLKTATACTHTHTCNPPGPSAATHTHTCLRTDLHASSSSGENTAVEGDLATKPRKPLGNREAVRKYREKKKAHAAFLEEEVRKLRATNQQLLKRLQGYAALEAEVARLRGLLLDVRGSIDSEIDASEFQRHCVVGSVNCTDADPSLCFDTDAAPEESSGPEALVDLEICRKWWQYFTRP